MLWISSEIALEEFKNDISLYTWRQLLEIREAYRKEAEEQESDGNHYFADICESVVQIIDGWFDDSCGVGVVAGQNCHLIEKIRHGMEELWIEENPDGEIFYLHPHFGLRCFIDELMRENNYTSGHSGTSRYGQWITVY